MTLVIVITIVIMVILIAIVNYYDMLYTLVFIVTTIDIHNCYYY